MIVTRENETLYPATFTFNTARLLTMLAKIVTDHGGKVKPLRTAILYNRTPRHAAIETETRLKAIQNAQNEKPTEKRQMYISELTEKLNRYKNYVDFAFRATHTTYIEFVYNGHYYYVQYDENPFFPHHYIKTPVNNNKFSRDASLDELTNICYDALFDFETTPETINECAADLFNKLTTLLPSTPIIRDGTKHRVKNYYNDGYHYETIYAPERFEKINF